MLRYFLPALAVAALWAAPAASAPRVLDVLGRYVCPNEAPILKNGECTPYVAARVDDRHGEGSKPCRKECIDDVDGPKSE